MKKVNIVRSENRPDYYHYVQYKPQKVPIEERNAILKRIQSISD